MLLDDAWYWDFLGIGYFFNKTGFFWPFFGQKSHFSILKLQKWPKNIFFLAETLKKVVLFISHGLLNSQDDVKLPEMEISGFLSFE